MRNGMLFEDDVNDWEDFINRGDYESGSDDDSDAAPAGGLSIRRLQTAAREAEMRRQNEMIQRALEMGMD